MNRGQTLGIIGESGCGKSVMAQSIQRIVPEPPGEIASGKILYYQQNENGKTEIVDLAQLDPKGKEIRRIRGKEVAMIFQEPMTSFGPLNTIGDQIMEVILLHQEGVKKKEARQRAIDLLGRVGIPRPDQHIDTYPHQLSGGMRQRAMIAMALSCRPSLLIADEPTTALDVTIQAQILDLIRDLRAEYGMAVMFITHNLGVIAEIAADIAVMYLGKIVEQSSVEELFDHPKHPYTRALLKSIPRIDEESNERLASIKGLIPDPYNVPKGCSFGDRCEEFITGTCDQAIPALTTVGDEHWVRCFLHNTLAETEQKEVFYGA